MKREIGDIVKVIHNGGLIEVEVTYADAVHAVFELPEGKTGTRIIKETLFVRSTPKPILDSRGVEIKEGDWVMLKGGIVRKVHHLLSPNTAILINEPGHLYSTLNTSLTVLKPPKL